MTWPGLGTLKVHRTFELETSPYEPNHAVLLRDSNRHRHE